MQRARTSKAKEARRTALLMAALDRVYRHGFAASRMDDIADAAGVAKGTLYLSFESKEALFAALIEDIAMPNVARLEAALASAPSLDDGLARLTGMAGTIIQQSPLPRLLKILIGESQAFPDILLNYRQAVVDRLLAALAGFLRRHGTQAADPALLARLVVAPVLLAALWQVLFAGQPDAPRADPRDVLALHRRMLLAGLAALEEPT